MGANRQQLVDQTLPVLAAAQTGYRDLAQSGQAPYCFVARRELNGAGLGLITIDSPDPQDDADHDMGHLVSYDAADGTIHNEPRHLTTQGDVLAALGELARRTDCAEDLWCGVIEKMAKAVEAKRFATDGSLVSALETGPARFVAAWLRRSQLIEDRAEQREAHSGTFVVKSNKVGRPAWRRQWRNPLTDQTEIHEMQYDYAWLLEEEPEISYQLVRPLTNATGRDLILVAPSDDHIEHADSVYREFDQTIEKVAAGECFYGGFRLNFGAASVPIAASLRLKNDDEGDSIYRMRTEDMRGFDLSKAARNSHDPQRCFFVVDRSVNKDSGLTVNICRMVGPPPSDTPKYFSGNQRDFGYVQQQLMLNEQVERAANQRSGMLFRRKARPS